MRHWNVLNNKEGLSFAKSAGEAIAEAGADHTAEATKSVPQIFAEAEKLRSQESNRGPWRSTIKDFLVRSGIDERFVLQTFEGISVFEPSNDGATGPLGHLGICIWRIA